MICLLTIFRALLFPPLKKGGRGDSRRAEYENPPRSPFFKGGDGSVTRHPENCSEACQIMTIAVALLLVATQLANAAQPVPATQKQVAQKSVVQKVFATPAEAAKALVEALRKHDKNLLLAVIGQSSRNWLSSGDEVADRHDKEKFIAAYDRKNSISQTTDDKAILLVGDDDWPFPAPIVRKGKGWVFDAAAGREEIINRRVGKNELDTIQTLLAVVDAQREYAAGDPDGNGYHDYARRFISHKGKKDGLYWPVQAGEPLSPLGPLVGAAAREGYGKKSGSGKSGVKPAAYHGYRYLLLEAQGKDAPGGAYSYLVNGKMIGGFAIVAYPAKFGVSGIMTFLVNHDGVVYQKDLGKSTEAEALRMRRFNPDAGWKKAQ